MVVDGKTAYLVVAGDYLGMDGRTISVHEDHASVFRNVNDMVTFRVAVDMTGEQIACFRKSSMTACTGAA